MLRKEYKRRRVIFRKSSGDIANGKLQNAPLVVIGSVIEVKEILWIAVFLAIYGMSRIFLESEAGWGEAIIYPVFLQVPPIQ